MKRFVAAAILLVCCLLPALAVDTTYYDQHTDYFGGSAGYNLGNLSQLNVTGGVTTTMGGSWIYHYGASCSVYPYQCGEWGASTFTRDRFLKTDPIRINFTEWWFQSNDTAAVHPVMGVALVFNSSNESTTRGTPYNQPINEAGMVQSIVFYENPGYTDPLDPPYVYSVILDGLGNISYNNGDSWSSYVGYIPDSFNIEFFAGDSGYGTVALFNGISVDINSSASPRAPVAAFTANRTNVLLGEAVQFTDASTFAPTSWNWSFGDGNLSTEQNPVYVYPKVKNYDVNLTVTNGIGSSYSYKHRYIYVGRPSLQAGFTSSLNPSYTGYTVTFTDNSTGYSIVAREWGFGDGTSAGGTPSDPNPTVVTHAYTANGSYNVSLHVANISGSESYAYATQVVNYAPSIAHQDIWMVPKYLITVNTIDSSTGLPTASGILMTDSDGQSFVTANGQGYLYEPYGATNITYVAIDSKYAGQTISYVFDQDETITVMLLPVSAEPAPYNVKYPPKDVRFHVQTLTGVSLSLACVTAVPVQTTLGNYDYVASLFGYDFAIVPLSNLTLAGYSDSRGDITFAMIPDVQYGITTTKSGYTFQPLNITPHDDNYLIIADYTGSPFVTNGTSPVASVTFKTLYTRVNQTVGFINISYVDIAGATTSGKVNITQTNKTLGGTTKIHIAGELFTGNASWKNFTLWDKAVAGCSPKTSVIYNSTGSISSCLNQTLVEGGSYQVSGVGYTPTGTVTQTGTAWFKSIASPIAGLSPEFALFIALGIMMFTALMAGTSTAPAISFVVTFEGWIFYGMNMFVIIDVETNSGASPVVNVLIIMTLITIVWLFVTFRRSNK